MQSNQLLEPQEVRVGKSRFPGIRFDKNTGRWQVNFRVGDRYRSLGLFASEVEAAEACDDYRQALGVAPEELNFPDRARRRRA